jgi:hypothetical protein
MSGLGWSSVPGLDRFFVVLRFSAGTGVESGKWKFEVSAQLAQLY